MDKILFKGIKQVTMQTFQTTEDKKGYLWFVREEVVKPEWSQSPFDVNRYHIYFGNKKYGESWDGLYDAIGALVSAINENSELIGTKQDIISDLDVIRSGAALGATALQEIPEEYVTESELSAKGYLTEHQDISHLATKVELNDKSDTGHTHSQYLTEHQDISGKQDVIGDLETIRSGAALGATALQSMPEHNHNEHYYTETEIDAKLLGKQDTILDITTIRSGAALGATALQSMPSHTHDDRYYTETEIDTKLSTKQDVISDLATIRSNASKGATALQSYTESDPIFSASAAANIKASDITNWNSKTSNTGTITEIKMNGSTKGTSGVVDLGTIITEHQDISGKQDVISDLATIRSNAAKGATALQSVPAEYVTEGELSDVATSGSYNDLTDKPVIPSIDGLATVTYVNQEIGKIQNSSYDDTEIKNQLANKADKSELFSKSYNDLTDKPTIPSAVTESTVSGWGFTKNTGTYSKPSSGIPKSDLASAVQTSLGKADTALQSYTEQYQGTVEAVDTTESIDGVSNDFVTSEQLDARGYATTASVNNEINTINNTIGVNTAGFTLADRITKLEDGYDAPDARANVLWIGTSIPAGDISFSNNGTTQSTTTNLGSNNYPKMVADVLGFNLYNNSRGSSFVCFYPSSEDGTSSWANASDWTEYSSQVWKGYSLSASFAQVEEKFGPNGLNCPEWLVNNFKSYSYESLIIPYIDGTLASCDTVVIDHGYNDRNIIINEASWHPNENETQFAIGAGRDWLLQLQDPLDSSLVAETYFQGKWWNDESVSSKKHYMSAMIFLCKKIWNVNPNIKIVIGNYFAKKTNVFASDFGSDRLAEFVLLANSAIANWLVVPCIDVWNYTGLYNRNLTAGNDYQLFCPDNVHPHSDSTGRSNSIIAGVYINKLRGTLYKK